MNYKIYQNNYFKAVLISIICVIALYVRFKKEIVSLKNNIVRKNVLAKLSRVNLELDECMILRRPKLPKNYHESCYGLFTSGSFVASKCQKTNTSDLRNCTSDVVAQEWKPDGCRLKIFTEPELENCFANFSVYGRNSIYVFGDERVRYLFEGFKSKLLGIPTDFTKYATGNKEYVYKNAYIHLKFFKYIHTNEKIFTSMLQILERPNPPIFILLANSLGMVERNKNYDPEYIREYENNLRKLRSVMSYLSDKTKVLWMLQPLVKRSKEDGNDSSIDSPVNDLIKTYNSIAIKIWDQSGVVVMNNVKQLDETLMKDFNIKTKYNNDLMASEMILNYVCNNQFEDIDNEFCCSRQDKIFPVS